MKTNMGVDIGDKSVYIRAFWPREDSQSTSQRSIQSNIPDSLFFLMFTWKVAILAAPASPLMFLSRYPVPQP
jgi:hypothetical protein